MTGRVSGDLHARFDPCRRLANLRIEFSFITNQWGSRMLLPDRHYSRLVNALTDRHEGSDYYELMGRAWVENQVQVVLCEADVYPRSSEHRAA